MKYSQIKAMLAVSKASFRSITRSPSAVVFTLVFPVIFIVVFGFIGNNGFRINVGVSSDCNKNNPVYYKAHFIPAIGLIESENDAEQIAELKKGKLDAILTIHADSLSPQHFVV